ncbi:MAG TPA: rRNA maturation RNase YbeY [Acidimicrobiia bacterium]|nr:rRNA maturation RNase YbeY [Acidimicrobiia bacterium]
MTPSAPVQVSGYDEQDIVPVEVPRWVRLAQLVLRAERVDPDAELGLVFVDEATIADLNQRFLDATGPTDVLAFPLDDELPTAGRDPDEGGRGPGSTSDAVEPPIILGDVVVCPTVAQRQADATGTALDAELALLVVHGVLHLLEYDHAEPGDAERMQRRERELLARFAELDERDHR